MTCAILEYILNEPDAIEKTTEKARIRTFLTQSFVFAFLWSVGGNVDDASRSVFETFARKQFEDNEDALYDLQMYSFIYISLVSMSIVPFCSSDLQFATDRFMGAVRKRRRSSTGLLDRHYAEICVRQRDAIFRHPRANHRHCTVWLSNEEVNRDK